MKYKRTEKYTMFFYCNTTSILKTIAQYFSATTSSDEDTFKNICRQNFTFLIFNVVYPTKIPCRYDYIINFPELSEVFPSEMIQMTLMKHSCLPYVTFRNHAFSLIKKTCLIIFGQIPKLVKKNLTQRLLCISQRFFICYHLKVR